MSSPLDAWQQDIASSWLRERPQATDIGILRVDGHWMILRLNGFLPNQTEVDGEVVDADHMGWKLGENLFLFKSPIARFRMLCAVLEEIPDAHLVASSSWVPRATPGGVA